MSKCSLRARARFSENQITVLREPDQSTVLRKHSHVLHVLRTYSTCSYPGYQDTTTYAALRTAQKYNVAFGGRNTGSVSPIWRAPPNASLMRTACSSTQQHSCKGPVEYLYVSSNFALQKLSYSITPASLIPRTAFINLIVSDTFAIYINLQSTSH